MLTKTYKEVLKNRALRAEIFITRNMKIITLALVLFFCFAQSLTMVADTSLGNALSNMGDNSLDEIVSVYTNSWFYLIFFGSLAGFLLLKNDKLKGACGFACVGSLVLFIIGKIAIQRSGGVIGQTLDEVTEWAN